MYIKIVLWRVAKRLSCIVYARCLRVNQCLYLLSERTQLLEHYAFICYLPHVSAVSGRHQVDITTTCMEKPSLQNFSCCTSTRFRVTAHPYGASRSYSLATLTSVGLFQSRDQSDGKISSNQQHSQQIPLQGFEPIIQASERLQAHNLNRATIGPGPFRN